MITVVSVTFSVLVVALTVSSQHFGPRLLGSFMRDQPAQWVLGTFTGTFAYCLMVLRTVQGDGGDRFSFFVPHLAVAGAVVLALVAVGMLIYYVHHIAVSMQVSEITVRIASELERTIERLYPEPLGEGSEPPARRPPPVPAGAARAVARASGYVQQIDSDAIMRVTARHDTTVWVLAHPGDFVVAGDHVAAIHPVPPDRDRCARSVANAWGIGADRTSDQDAGFGVQQLVEVALRALSPATNEPFTAITAIDRLAQALSRLAARRIPSAVRCDEEGRVRVVALPQTFGSLLQAAFEPIALYGGRNPAIGARLLERLDGLASGASRREDRAAVSKSAESVWNAIRRDVDDESRALLTRIHGRVQRACNGEEQDRAAGPRRAAGGLPAT
jgi:uncharacterized membrane protein